MLFIGYLYGIRSERRLVEEVKVNVAYRWFLGFALEDKIPDANIAVLCEKLMDIYYSGDQNQWNKVKISDSNGDLSKARIHYLTDGINHYEYVTKEATCTENGFKKYVCPCGYSYGDTISAHGHKYKNGVCVYCGADQNGGNASIAPSECHCVCHAKHIGRFIYNLFKLLDAIFDTNLLYKVFGITEICSCGIAHY